MKRPSSFFAALCCLACCACQKPFESRLQTGDVAAAGGKWAEARDAWLEATKLDPSAAAAHARLGVAYWQLDDHPRASAEWSAATAIEPTNSIALEGLTRSDLEASDAGAALARLAQVPTPEGTVRLALARALLARGAPDDAANALRHAQAHLLSAPDDVEAQYLVGSAQIALRRFADAQATLDGLQRAHPEVMFGSYGLARLAAAQNRTTDALLNLTAAKAAAGARWNATQVATDPAFAFLTATPEFKTLVGK